MSYNSFRFHGITDPHNLIDSIIFSIISSGLIYALNRAKIDNVNTGMKIAEQIVRIGSALSGLLQPLRIVFVKRMAMMT